MDRRKLILSSMATAGLSACASTAQPRDPANANKPAYDTGTAATYSADEMIRNTSDFLGVTAESAGAAVERAFRDNGQPTGYIAGEEGSGAIAVGLRYG